MLAALVCAATLIQFPFLSQDGGYVNLGDCFVLICGWILGPFWGMAAAGIGSMLADLLSGYANYAAGTLVIKAAVALTACLLAKALLKVIPRLPAFSRIISAVCAEIVMVAGYFGYSVLLLGNGLSALQSIPGNLLQGFIGAIAGITVYSILSRIGITAKMQILYKTK